MGSSRSSRDSHIQLFLELRDDWGVAGVECGARAELAHECQLLIGQIDCNDPPGAGGDGAEGRPTPPSPITATDDPAAAFAALKTGLSPCGQLLCRCATPFRCRLTISCIVTLSQ
jgi:hypothetical protein